MATSGKIDFQRHEIQHHEIESSLRVAFHACQANLLVSNLAHFPKSHRQIFTQLTHFK
jgi:hypothetical protein